MNEETGWRSVNYSPPGSGRIIWYLTRQSCGGRVDYVDNTGRRKEFRSRGAADKTRVKLNDQPDIYMQVRNKNEFYGQVLEEDEDNYYVLRLPGGGRFTIPKKNSEPYKGQVHEKI